MVSLHDQLKDKWKGREVQPPGKSPKDTLETTDDPEEKFKFLVTYELLLSKGLFHLDLAPQIKDAHFDCMICYRVKTEGESDKIGNSFANMLNQKLLDEGVILQQKNRNWLGEGIPRGTYPEYAKVQEQNTDTEGNIRIFFDQKCLKEGFDWLEGFSNALCNTLVLIPLMSIQCDDEGDYIGSVGQLLSLDPQKEDKVDNFLLEITIANALMDLPKERRWLQAIIPILMGQWTGNQFQAFDYSKLAQLSKHPSMATVKIATAVLRKMGYPVSKQMLTRSVYDNVNLILRMQGILLWKINSSV